MWVPKASLSTNSFRSSSDYLNGNGFNTGLFTLAILESLVSLSLSVFQLHVVTIIWKRVYHVFNVRRFEVQVAKHHHLIRKLRKSEGTVGSILVEYRSHKGGLAVSERHSSNRYMCLKVNGCFLVKVECQLVSRVIASSLIHAFCFRYFHSLMSNVMPESRLVQFLHRRNTKSMKSEHPLHYLTNRFLLYNSQFLQF